MTLKQMLECMQQPSARNTYFVMSSWFGFI